MKILGTSRVNLVKTRPFVQLLNYYFNKIDPKRVKTVGADRACAEWLMRNGAFIRWRQSSDFVAHYNDLPLDESDKTCFFIEEVHADNASITHHGFEHFRGCSCIKKITFKNCVYFNDQCIALLGCVPSLRDLTISGCQEVTCHGIMQLACYQSLQNVTIGKSNKLSGETLQLVVESLQAALPRSRVSSECPQ